MFWYVVQYFYMKYRRKWQKMDISQVKYRNIVLTCITSVYFISYPPPMALMDILTFYCMDFFLRIYFIHMEIQTSVHCWLCTSRAKRGSRVQRWLWQMQVSNTAKTTAYGGYNESSRELVVCLWLSCEVSVCNMTQSVTGGRSRSSRTERKRE